MDQPEVLVHVSAPASRLNDDLFRSLADAYLDFEPHEPRQYPRAIPDDGVLLPLSNPVIAPQYHPPSSSGQRQALVMSGHVAPAIPSMDSYGSFPSFVTSGDPSSDDQGPKIIKVPSSLEAEYQEEEEEVAISRLERLERIQARWKQQTPRSGPANNRSLLLPVDNGPFLEDTQQAFAAVESQLMDSLSTTSEEEEEEAEMEEDAIPLYDDGEDWGVTLGEELETTREPIVPHAEPRVEESLVMPLQSSEQTEVQSTQPTKSSQNTHIYTTPSSTHCSISMVSIETTTRPQTRSQTRSQTRPQTQSRIQLSPSQQSIVSAKLDSKEISPLIALEESACAVNFKKLPTTVSPIAANAKVSMESPGTLPSQITPYLEKLKQQVSERFQPKDPKALKPDDRGCWRIDCQLWPKHVQHGFWCALQKDVESGRLGWGITLHRDAARMRLGQVRLYCWGEIAEHIWLSLWLHSGGRVRSTGAVWMDADDEEIMTIP